MRIIILSICFLFCAHVASAQFSYVNPDSIARAGDIILQNTDVYYGTAVSDTDNVRDSLCNQSANYRDPNGLYHGYEIKVRGSLTGQYWQRLFTARDKPTSA